MGNTKFRLTISHYKILQTINELNKMNRYPTPQGVNNILRGSIDEETREYISLKTFGTLISFQGRKLCSYVLNTVRRGYLTYIYDPKTDGMYLRLTELGEASVFEFERKRKVSYKRKEKKLKKEIVEIK